jgi:hypothetical protein
MTENPTTDPGLVPSPLVQAQVAELRELAKQFPAPTLAEVMGDWKWLYAQWNSGNLFHLADRFIAVCERQIVGSDEGDELALRIRLSKQHQKHPERFAISYLGEYIRPEIG